jgi:diguanylate cyclase (GGDEF)-like protein
MQIDSPDLSLRTVDLLRLNMFSSDTTLPAADRVSATAMLQRLTQLIGTVLTVLVLLGVLAFKDGQWLVGNILFCAVMLLVVSLVLARKSHIDVAAKLMLATLTVMASILIFTSQGLRDEAVCSLPAILVFAAMFGTRRLFISTLVFFLTMLTAVTAGNVYGWHVNEVRPASWDALINLCAVLVATAFFVWLIASDLRNALKRLGHENARIRESHARIDVLAHHDHLTGLANRLMARERFERAINEASVGEPSVVLMFLDLDNFKVVNDSLGHAAGDLLLCEVSRRLQVAMGPNDLVSRHGGDEFLVILTGLNGHDAALVSVERIMAQLAAVFPVQGLALSTTCSIGIARYPDDGRDFESLLKHADMAMYRAKDAGRNTFAFYDGGVESNVLDHLQLVTGIRTALAAGHFQLHYQPQFALASGAIIGAEALIRWRHPDLGMIPPAKFIAVAERAGLINEIGVWVLNEACRQMKAWQMAGLNELVVAINLSPVQFKRGNIEQDVLNALDLHALSPACLELELTESLLIAEASHLPAMLKRLRNMGIRLSIDDFGTGYSNLGYLRRFEVERLKIDQSFVRRMLRNSDDAGIVRAIIQMAHSLNLEAVAEGIEDGATLAALNALGCENGQGFHWSPALPPEEFYAFVIQARQAGTAHTPFAAVERDILPRYAAPGGAAPQSGE